MNKTILKNVAKVQIGISAPKMFENHNENTVPFIRAGLLEDLCNNNESYTEFLDKEKFKTIPNNTVIFAKSGMSALKNRVYTTKEECVIVGHLVGVICDKEKLLPKYLEYFLRFNKPSYLIQNDSYPSIRTEDIEKIVISLPSIDAQLQIIRQLDCITSLISKKKRMISLCSDLIKSQFVGMFGDIKYKHELWDRVKWKDVVTIQNGRDYKKIVVSSGGYPVYGTGGEMARASEYLCPENTIIVGRKGSINNPMLVKEKFWNVDTAFGVIPGERLNYQYFYYFCKNFNFLSLNKATTLPSTTKADLLKIEINIPPIELQNKFAQIVEQIDKQKFEFENSLKKLEELQASLMQEYFG